MTDEWEVRLAIVPPNTPSQAKRLGIINGKPRLFKSGKLQETEEIFAATLALHAPPEPIRGPVDVEVRLTWPWRGKDSKKVRAAGTIWHDTKPDLDNWSKAFMDMLVKLRFIEDDAKVARLVLEKRRGDDVGVFVRLRTMGAPPRDRAPEPLNPWALF